MADYSQNQINSMRQDAIRRVQEMQSRSQNFVRTGPQENLPVQPAPNNAPLLNNTPPVYSPPPQNNTPPPMNGNRNGNFQNNPGPNGNPPQGNSGFGGLGNLGGNLFSSLFGTRPSNAGALPEQAGSQERKGLLGGLLDNFFPNAHLDDDKIIIIILIIILARNGSDIKLLLALGYLLM